jgi:ankyrin repeat protein
MGKDAAFARFLLDAGLNPNLRDSLNYTPLAYVEAEEMTPAQCEELALVLFEGGADPTANDRGEPDGYHRKTFREDAEHEHWTRVLAWLDAHPSQGSSTP